MKTSRLKVRADHATQFGYCWMAMLAIYWCGLFLTPNQMASKVGIRLLIAAIGLSLAVAGWRWGRTLADGARVLGSVRAPRTLWREWRHASLVALSLRWGAAVLAGTLALALKDAEWTWSCAAFLYSSVLVASLVASLSHHGVWHWGWPWGIALSVVAAMTLAGWHGFDQLLQLPAIWHLALALSWPLFVASLAWRWREHPPQGVATRRRVQFNPLHRCMSYVRRYTPLNINIRDGLPVKNKWPAQNLTMIGPMAYLMILRASMLKGQWGSEAGLLYLASLGLLVIFASTTLVCKDLHWRRLLAPDGFPRGRLGWHIISSTLAASSILIALVVALIGWVLMVCSWSGVDIGLRRSLEPVAAYGVLPLEFVLVVCLGVALRATRRPVLTYFVALFAVAAMGLIPFRIFSMKAVMSLFVIGPSYVAWLLLAIGAAIMLANRLWTTQRLLPYVAVGVPTSENAVEGGRWLTWPGRPY